MMAVGYPRPSPDPKALHISSESEEEIQKTMLNNVKLKNELCRNYLETGYCKYHQKCQFAHGIEELRQHREANNKYKTKRCLSYFERACCSYGDRCNFQHEHCADHPEGLARQAKANFRDLFWHARPRSRPF